MKVKLTPRGHRLIAASLMLLGLGAVLRDAPLAAAALIVWTHLLLVRRRVQGYTRGLPYIKASPDAVKGRLTAGRTHEETLSIDSPIQAPVKLRVPLTGATLEPDQLEEGMNQLRLKYTPSLSGVYTCKSLEARTGDRLGLVEGLGDAGLGMSFKVYPRVYPRALEALEFMAESGQAPEGAQTTHVRGRSLEYAESREYLPGDPLNSFDWKAMARMGKPFVKQFYVESGGGVEILFDPVAPDPVSLDELNAAFLELAVSLVRSEAPIRLSMVDGVAGLATGPYEVVEAALRITLEGRLEEFREYYMLLEPSRARLFDRVIDGLGAKKRVEESMGQMSGSLVVLSSLSRDQAALLSLVRDRAGGMSVAVVQPTRPWVWADDLQTGARILIDNRRKLRVFEKMGVRAFPNARAAASHRVR